MMIIFRIFQCGILYNSPRAKKSNTVRTLTFQRYKKDEIWELVRVILTTQEQIPRHGKNCPKDTAVSWASKLNPEDNLDLCEGCQVVEFGGWLVGVGPIKTTADSNGGNNTQIDYNTERKMSTNDMTDANAGAAININKTTNMTGAGAAIDTVVQVSSSSAAAAAAGVQDDDNITLVQTVAAAATTMINTADANDTIDTNDTIQRRLRCKLTAATLKFNHR